MAFSGWEPKQCTAYLHRMRLHFGMASNTPFPSRRFIGLLGEYFKVEEVTDEQANSICDHVLDPKVYEIDYNN